jgi:intracellular sulfur oxidation DsrE/DsrF family protein
MKKLVTAAALTLFIPVCGICYAQSPAKHRIVMELSTRDTSVWRAAVGSISKLKKGWGDDVQIEVVVHGAGIGFLLKGIATQEDAIKELKAKGVQFAACANTLKDHNIDRSQVIPEAGIVPMGIGEIVLKQESGWSYIKEGQ